MRLIKSNICRNALIIVLSTFYFSGCVSTKIKPDEKKGKVVNRKHNSYYGTYTRVGHNGSFFVDGKSGELWYIVVTPKGQSSFTKKLNLGLNELGKLHRIVPVFEVELMGNLSNTSDNDAGLKSHPFLKKNYPSKILRVNKVLKLSPVKQLNPTNCFTIGVPCSSVGMARYKG